MLIKLWPELASLLTVRSTCDLIMELKFFYSIDLFYVTHETTYTPISTIHVGRNEAIEALKQSVNLDNPADWQLLVELTNELEEEQQQERLASLS